MSRLGFVVAAKGIIQPYGDGSRLLGFYNGVTKFSPALTGPLPRRTVVSFGVGDQDSAINVTPTGAFEPEATAPRLSYAPE